jgi:hypothetical protein
MMFTVHHALPVLRRTAGNIGGYIHGYFATLPVAKLFSVGQ